MSDAISDEAAWLDLYDADAHPVQPLHWAGICAHVRFLVAAGRAAIARLDAAESLLAELRRERDEAKRDAFKQARREFGKEWTRRGRLLGRYQRRLDALRRELDAAVAVVEAAMQMRDAFNMDDVGGKYEAIEEADQALLNALATYDTQPKAEP